MERVEPIVAPGGAERVLRPQLVLMVAGSPCRLRCSHSRLRGLPPCGRTRHWGPTSSPYSHLHGAVLLLAPLGLALARPMQKGSTSQAWQPLLMGVYMLALVVWPFEQQRWLLTPCFVLVMVALTVQCRTVEGATHGKGV